ncbi:MAG: 30S ribosomal protein S12 methylthiotransferase RimO [Thermodesulfobacteriota bacterium]
MSGIKIMAVSLGCPKNRVDLEVMLGLLAEAGYEIVDDPFASQIILINTCGFIQPAVEEAIEEILAHAELKEKNPDLKLVVTGCLVQRYGLTLAKQLPEVDLFIGTDGFQEIVARLKSLTSSPPPATPSFVMDSSMPRILTTPSHRAFLKISEGCSNRCAYCLIPAIRGPLRSRTMNDLIQEAEKLDATGVRELTLVAQDLTAYGVDLADGQTNLHALLQQLLSRTTIPWLRLLYLYPSSLSSELLELMAAEERLLNYLDIPLQHVASSVLKAMRRPFSPHHVHEVIERIRATLPQAVIRTTFMVGFPGETWADVEEIAKFLQDYRLNNVGIFTYCNEEGCAAAEMAEQIPEEEKKERYNYLMEVQAPISLAHNEALLGRTIDVLVDGVSDETELLLTGRTRFQAPEIDGCVYINEGKCNSGDMVRVRITDAHPYDLVGGIVEEVG